MACILAAHGCETEVQNLGKRPETRAPNSPGSSSTRTTSRPASNPQPPPKTQSKAKPGFIVGKQTQEIRNAQAELQQGKAKVASTRIVSRDPITLPGNTYVNIIGQTSMNSIKQALDLYHAANDRYPKDYDEFMAEIIKANNIALRQLPPYQEYGYDSNEHKLIILEYEDRKVQSP